MWRSTHIASIAITVSIPTSNWINWRATSSSRRDYRHCYRQMTAEAVSVPMGKRSNVVLRIKNDLLFAGKYVKITPVDNHHKCRQYMDL